MIAMPGLSYKVSRAVTLSLSATKTFYKSGSIVISVDGVTLNIQPGIYDFICWEKGSNIQFLFPPNIDICPE